MIYSFWTLLLPLGNKEHIFTLKQIHNCNPNITFHFVQNEAVIYNHTQQTCEQVILEQKVEKRFSEVMFAKQFSPTNYLLKPNKWQHNKNILWCKTNPRNKHFLFINSAFLCSDYLGLGSSHFLDTGLRILQVTFLTGSDLQK